MSATPIVSPPGAGEVQLWLLRPAALEIAKAEQVLSPDERLRAERYRLTADRVRFVATRAALRVLLGRSLGQPAETLVFAYGRLGQPRVAGPLSSPAFSVAHSGGFAVIALGRDQPLGVDIEDLAVPRDIDRIARAILPEAEHRDWSRLPPGEAKRALLQAWTRREAVGKALGTGVPLSAAEQQAAAAASDGLFVIDLAVADGCVAAIATGECDPRVSLADYIA